MKKIAVLFSGKGSNFACVVEALHLEGCEVVALTNNPLAGGIEVAHKHGIALEVVDSKSFAKREDFDARIVDILSKYSPDLTVLAGFISFEDYDRKIRQIEKEVLVKAIKQVLQEENKHEDI